MELSWDSRRAIACYVPSGAVQLLGRVTFDVEIGGIRGRITHFLDFLDGSLHWKFTCSGSSTPVWVAAGTRIKPLPGSSRVLWIGANGIEDTERVKAVISKVVDAHTAVAARVYVIQLPPRCEYSFEPAQQQLHPGEHLESTGVWRAGHPSRGGSRMAAPTRRR